MSRISVGHQKKSEWQARIKGAAKAIRNAEEEQDAVHVVNSLLADVLDEISRANVNRDLPDPARSHLAASDLAAENYSEAIQEWRKLLTTVSDHDLPPGNTFYHVTHHENLVLIETEGLKSQRGDRVSAIGDEEGVYLFSDMDTAEDAVCNWLGDELDDTKDLVFLEITLSDAEKANLARSEAEFELIYNGTIPPSAISVSRVDPAMDSPIP